MQNKAIIFSAPSGSGKTTILKNLLEIPDLKIEFSISATSRKPRPGEVEGVDYYYYTEKKFLELVNEGAFIEWEQVYAGFYYGTLKTELDRIWNSGKLVAFDVDVKGGLKLKELFGDQSLLIFVRPPSVKELERRLRNRGTESEETLRLRIDKAVQELEFEKYFDRVVINDVLKDTIDCTYRLIKEFIEK